MGGGGEGEGKKEEAEEEKRMLLRSAPLRREHLITHVFLRTLGEGGGGGGGGRRRGGGPTKVQVTLKRTHQKFQKTFKSRSITLLLFE